MENLLVMAQTLFYFVVSAAIIIFAVLFGIATVHLIHIAKQLEKISRHVHDASDEMRKRVKEIIERLSQLPILSYFLKHAASRDKGQEK